MMKSWQKHVFIIAFGLYARSLGAQQVPITNQYFYTPTLAYASASNFAERPKMGVIYRGQWSNIQGGPETFVINYTNPRDRKTSYHISLNSFELGVLKQGHLSFGLSKSFNSGEHYFSIGSELGASLFSLNEDRVSTETIDDQLLQQLIGNQGIGLFVSPSFSYRRKYFSIDFSAPGFIRQSISNDSYAELNSDNQVDFLASLGYSIALDPLERIFFKPSITWREQRVLGSKVDITAELDFLNKLRLTAGYRPDFGSVIGVGFKVKPNILFTYQYEFGNPEVPFISNGFNEIGLHLTFKNQEEKDASLEAAAQAIVDLLRRRGIYNPDLISNKDKDTLIGYLFSIQVGKKKERLRKANQAFELLLEGIERQGTEERLVEAFERQLKADSVIRVQQEIVRMDSIRAFEESIRLRDLELVKEAEQTMDRAQTEIKRQLSIAAKSISFNSASAVLKEESFASLDEIVELLRANNHLRLMLSGHTDNSGNALSNLKLSKDRAKAVKAYLVSKGIAADRLTSEGYGIELPIATNKTAEGRKVNRRVEIEVIDNN